MQNQRAHSHSPPSGDPAYCAGRQKGVVQEIAYYSATSNSDTIFAFYEKTLGGGGWEENARYEHNSGPNNAHQIISVWKKDTRTASLTIVDLAEKSVQIQVTVENLP